jgi:hypothetical protein
LVVVLFLVYFLFFLCFLLQKHNGWTYAQYISGLSVYYGHPSGHYTSGLIAMNSYYTTLKNDECVAVFFKVCGHATKSLKHMEVWKGSWIYEESTFWEFFKKYKVKLWHISYFG